jgi:hypothetical protein
MSRWSLRQSKQLTIVAGAWVHCSFFYGSGHTVLDQRNAARISLLSLRLLAAQIGSDVPPCRWHLPLPLHNSCAGRQLVQLFERINRFLPEFLGENEGIWDEVPALRLARPILGLEVVIGGSPGIDRGYTVQVSSEDTLGGVLPNDPEESKSAICDFSNYLAALIQKIPGTEMKAS